VSGHRSTQYEDSFDESADHQRELDHEATPVAALGHADAEGASASTWHPTDVSLSRWPGHPAHHTSQLVGVSTPDRFDVTLGGQPHDSGSEEVSQLATKRPV